ncbi:M23 family metallopeptidase [Arthrobacter sp. zg-Y411]|uniref:M23 family metallopeptidase n=1 Tax=Arthrobacter zhangbolii TaxID=2886936 RepID=UPI001D13CE8F|nr:M23 family metallopeptidase [Arthrobacter zhangbolii]MCC3294107.1 M23 family metallopeptidase [Arthrobacter zhangbolii]
MTEHFLEPARAYETVSSRMMLRTVQNLRNRAADLLERRPPGEHAALRKPRDFAADAEQLRVRAKALRGRTRAWLQDHDTPNRRTGALGVAAAVALSGVVAGTAATAEPELKLERQAMVTTLDTDAGREAGEGAPATEPEPAAEPPVNDAPAPEPAPEPAEPGPVAPVDDMVVTSPFGYRDNPLAPGYPEFHTGTDFGAVTGTPVKSMLGGTVVEASWHTTGGGGLRVVVDHGDGLQTTYNHLNSIDVSVGQNLDAGAVVGGVGSTGNSTGPHLHFEVLRHGDYEDPMGWL